MTMPESAPDLMDDGPSPWAGTRMTYDEFLALPEAKPYLEYSDGVVSQKVAPKLAHSEVQGAFYDAFNQHARPRRLGRAYTELRLVTPGWSPVPDVVYYRLGRIPPGSRQPSQNLRVPPDIAVEVVSPTQSFMELVRKCLRYLDVGVAVAVLADPGDEAMLIFRPGQEPVALRGDDPIDLEDVVPGLDLTVRGLFELAAWGSSPDEVEAEPTAAEEQPPA